MATAQKIAAPKTAAEARTLLQDSTDHRDALDRRFQAGDPPPASEWGAALERVTYAQRSLDGLIVREQGESVVTAREGALAARKRYKTTMAKQLALVIGAEDELAKAARVLVETVAGCNGRAFSLSEEVRALRPSHLPADTDADYLKGALRFGGSIPPAINPSALFQSVVHGALTAAFKDLGGRDLEFLRSLEGPGLSESKRVRNLALTLAVKE